MPTTRARQNTQVAGWQSIQYVVATEREKTASRLAGWLIALLAGTIFAHYVAVIAWGTDPQRDDQLSKIFNSLLPVVSGLAGSAVTYYYTREKK